MPDGLSTQQEGVAVPEVDIYRDTKSNRHLAPQTTGMNTD